MNTGSTNVIVLRLKEIVYTLIFLILGIFLIFLMIHMFSSGQSSEETSAAVFHPGVYSSEVNLGGQTVNVEVTVDEERINAVRLVNLSDSVATMYPLVEPAMESIAEQVIASQSLDDVVIEENQKYTGDALLTAVSETLSKAAVSEKNHPWTEG